MNILGITPGKNIPSSRFRIRQYVKELKKQEVFVTEKYQLLARNAKIPFLQAKTRYSFPVTSGLYALKLISNIPQMFSSHFYDGTWLNRTLLPYILLEKYLKKPIFFDVDDAIWLNKNVNIPQVAQISLAIFAGNSFIADKLSQYNKNIEIIPTAIDIRYFKPSIKREGRFIIGWTGSKDNLKYLIGIEEPLSRLMLKYQDVYLKIICDSKPAFNRIPEDRVLYTKWTSASEVQELNDIVLGIMPLEDSQWARGKCSFKMLQYMAMKKPVIVSPVGMNVEVMQYGQCGLMPYSDDDWYDALQYIYTNPSQAEKWGKKGREIVKNHFCVEVIASKISEAFKKYI